MDLYDTVTVVLVIVGVGILLWCAMKSGTGVGKPPTPRERTEMESLRMQLAAADGGYQRMLTLLITEVHKSPADVIVCFLAIFGIEERPREIPKEVLDALGDPQRFKAELEKHYDLVIETSWRDNES